MPRTLVLDGTKQIENTSTYINKRKIINTKQCIQNNGRQRMPRLITRKDKIAAILIFITALSITSIYLINGNIFTPNSLSKQSNTNKLYIDEIWFEMKIKENYHKITIIFHTIGPNITLTNVYFHKSETVNTSPVLPFKMGNEGRYKLTVILYNPAYNPLWIDNYTSYHVYLKFLNYFKRDLDRDKPVIIYKDADGEMHKISFSLYNYLQKYVLKYYYTEYDYDIAAWSTGSLNLVYFPNEYESCTALLLTSYSDKPIHIYLVKLYMYDKYHRLIRIERYKENVTLAPHTNLTLNICFRPTPKRGLSFIEKYGKVYVYTEEGVIRTFEQSLFLP